MPPPEHDDDGLLPADTRQLHHLQHIPPHTLTQVVKYATIDAKETFGRDRCSRDAQVPQRHAPRPSCSTGRLSGHDAEGRKLHLIQRPPWHSSTSASIGMEGRSRQEAPSDFTQCWLLCWCRRPLLEMGHARHVGSSSGGRRRKRSRRKSFCRFARCDSYCSF